MHHQMFQLIIVIHWLRIFIKYYVISCSVIIDDNHYNVINIF